MVERTTLIEKIKLENGELYAITGSSRHILARCTPILHVYETATELPVLGGKSGNIKKYHAVIVLCKDTVFTRRADDDFLATVSRFEIAADYWRADGIFEKIDFGVTLSKIIADDRWEFEVDNPMALLNRISKEM